MEEKWIAHVGPHKVDIRQAVRDPRGIEDRVKEILEKDFVESRYAQFGARLNIMPDAADLEDWDRALLERYEPLYGRPHDTCTDCELGPCQLKKADGKCGLKLEAYQGKLSLRKACRGCVSQMVVTRHQLNHALKLWNEDTPVSMGDLLTHVRYVPSGRAGERHLREDAQGSEPGGFLWREPTGQAHGRGLLRHRREH